MSEAATSQIEPSRDESGQQWLASNRQVVDLGLLWLRAELDALIRHRRASGPPATASAAISDVEEDRLLRGQPHDRADEAIEARRRFEAARQAMRQAGEPAQIDRLSMLFRLSPFDEDILLMAAAPQLEAGFAALYGYAHDRMQISAATPYLALTLLARGDSEAVGLARSRLLPDAPLRRLALVRLIEPVSSLVAVMEIDERLVHFLVGHDYVDPRVRPLLASVEPSICPAAHRAAIDRLTHQVRAAHRPAVSILGPRRSGRRAAARHLAGKFGLDIVALRASLLPTEVEARRAFLALLAREAALGSFAILLDTASYQTAMADMPATGARDLIEAILTGLDAFIIMISEEPVELSTPLPHIRFKALEADHRAALWRVLLGSSGPEAASDIDVVSEHFSLGPSEIFRIASEVRSDGAAGLWAACREAASRDLKELAERIGPRYGWSDIVLPQHVVDDMRAIVAQVRHRADVYSRGGFARKLVRGRGITVLFAGPSGVGKTMAAEVIAHDVALDLYRVDLSGIVSKYIGETEKNLRRVFAAAEASGAVLLFDEADALFGKRSEVKDSHDRYANIEIGYLLQLMEAYSGLAILATNLKTHLDAAFLRRIRFVIDLPFPDAALRRTIWQRVFPAETVVEGLDCDALSRLEIAGGNIAVIAVNAAFLAASERCPVRMAHIARAARAEFRKLDKEFRASWADGY